jgi:DNA-binding winged helix-turn-helix (wHTH) protein
VYVEERTVDVHVRRLRRALTPLHGDLIETVRGLGYRWNSAPDSIPTPALCSSVSRLVARVHNAIDSAAAQAFVA